MELTSIKPDLMVHAKELGSAAKGIHIGSVDHLDGDFIKLKKTDSDDGAHHWIPVDWVEKVDDKAIYISKSESEYKAERMDEQPLTS
jgi:hypothetical protein